MRFTLLLALFAASCCGRYATTPHSTDSGAARRIAEVPIANFAQVAEGVYRGAQPDAEGWRALQELGVRTVVNFRSAHSDREAAAAHGMECIELPMRAFLDSEPPTDADIRTFLTTVTDPARRPVFFHCAQGKDRTGAMCAVYRMEVEGWEPERCYDEMQSFGFHDVYQDLEDFVRGYCCRGVPAR